MAVHGVRRDSPNSILSRRTGPEMKVARTGSECRDRVTVRHSRYSAPNGIYLPRSLPDGVVVDPGPVSQLLRGDLARAPSTADQRARRLAPVDVPLPLLAATVVAPVLVRAFCLMDAVFPVAALLLRRRGLPRRGLLRYSLLGRGLLRRGLLRYRLLGRGLLRRGLLRYRLLRRGLLAAAFGAGAAFFGAALLDADGPGGTADGASPPDEVSTVTVPGPGITIVSSCEGQRTRSIDPMSAVTTPSRSGPFPDARRIR